MSEGSKSTGGNTYDSIPEGGSLASVSSSQVRKLGQLARQRGDVDPRTQASGVVYVLFTRAAAAAPSMAVMTYGVVMPLTYY
jgi:hypothetical protein